MAKPSIIPCSLLPETKRRIEDYAQSLTDRAHEIGAHGLSRKDFWDAGIFRSAVERIRGTQAASMHEKRNFIEEVLDHIKQERGIKEWEFSGVSERHDYEASTRDGTLSVIESKGCLDGNNTNIFERPPQAEEFIIWSLCQNPGADPRHNAWSGIHTRLSAEIIHRKQKVDGLIIWDMVCGTQGRPCPKVTKSKSRYTTLKSGKKAPPPCIYLFPKTIPDPRDNPSPNCWKLEEVKFLHLLWKAFQGDEQDIVSVQIEARMKGSELQRKTHFIKAGVEFCESEWITIRRAKR